MFRVRPAGSGGHRWYAFPEMRADEVVGFRALDSTCVDFGHRFWRPQSAFAGPLHDDVPARSSIEVRATCLYLT